MAINWVDVCNMALAMLGGAGINSVEEASTEAEHCRKHLSQSRREVLSAHPWNSATAWAIPALMGESGKDGNPVWPFKYAFVLPNDLLRVVSMERGRPEGSHHVLAASPAPFRVATHDGVRILLCDNPAPTIRYVADVSDAGALEPAVVKCIVLLLASRLAIPVAESQQRAASFLQMHVAALADAKLEDAREGYDVILVDDPYARARLSSASGCSWWERHGREGGGV